MENKRFVREMCNHIEKKYPSSLEKVERAYSNYTIGLISTDEAVFILSDILWKCHYSEADL